VQIKRLRERLGFTQVELATHPSVSFSTVNRWENGKTKPTLLAWQQIMKLDGGLMVEDVDGSPSKHQLVILDFAGRPEIVRTLAQGDGRYSGGSETESGRDA